MKQFRRLLSMMMVLCLILTLLPMPARAVGTELEPIQVTQVNPLYEGIVTEEDLLPVGEPFSFFAEPVYETDKGVLAAQLREAMVNRLETVTLYYMTGDSDAFSAALMHELLDMALVHTGVPIEGDYLAYQYGGWGGSMGGYTDGTYDYIELTYTLTYYTSYEQEEAVTAQVDALLNSLDLAGMTDYQKIKAVYDYMCQNITYDYAHLNNSSYKLQFTAYGALINKTSVCQGYAVLLYRLLLELGIDCRVIPGIGNGGPHAWNIIKVGNYYYNADSTWDAGSGHYDYFLRGSDYFPDHYRDADWDASAYSISSTDYDPNAEAENPYVATGTCGDDLTWTLDKNGLLTVSGTGEMDDFFLGDMIYGPWVGIKEQVKSVKIEPGVTTIGSGAFYDFPNLTSVSLPEGLTSIGDHAFAYCEALPEVIIPAGVTYIGIEGFYNCFSITKLEVPDTVSTIGDYAFMGCQGLTSLDIPAELKQIGNYVYACCNAVTSVTIPDGVTSIGAHAFWGCEGMSSVTIPETVTQIGSNAFRACVSLTTVQIPDSVETIGDEAFAICEGLISVDLGEGVENIGYHAFYDCLSLTSVTIPSSVEKLGEGAFESCWNLATVEFLGDAPSIGANAFPLFTGLTFYYPTGNSTWTEEIQKACGGENVWVSSCPDHAYEETTVKPDCVNGGYTAMICIICGHSYATDEVPALGHHPVTDKAVAATCTASGLTEGSHCDRCTAVLIPQEVTPALGHQWQEATCKAPKTCSACGATSGKKGGHVYDNGVDGTCNLCGIDRVNTVKRQVHHMLRMYNPNTGEHFYTGSEVERDDLIAAGWNYEGVAFTFPANTGAPVYRLFEPVTGEHLYTMDEAEKDLLLSKGWNYEGIAFNSAYDTEAVQHRLYNPNTTVGAYHFTFSEEEMQNLIDAGWWYQGIGWYSCWK